MKTTFYLFTVLVLALAACSKHETPKEVPFEIMPEGLKKKVEAELMEHMKQEVIENHRTMHELYSSEYPPWYCDLQLRNILEIKKNVVRQIMVRGEINPKETIEELVRSFYLTNESLSKEETRAHIQNPSYPFIEYPFYSSISKENILIEIEENKFELNRAIEDHEEEYIQFYSQILHEWERRKEAIEVLGVIELKEIHPQTNIRIDDELNREGLSPLTIEALKGIISVRDYASRKYLNLSYIELYFQATRDIKPEAKKRLEAIDFLFQTRIIDYSYAELNNLKTDRVEWEIEEIELP